MRLLDDVQSRVEDESEACFDCNAGRPNERGVDDHTREVGGPKEYTACEGDGLDEDPDAHGKHGPEVERDLLFERRESLHDQIEGDPVG